MHFYWRVKVEVTTVLCSDKHNEMKAHGERIIMFWKKLSMPSKPVS
jgi:hypothetical protein